jgi:methionyl-tRNA formyltransferase
MRIVFLGLPIAALLLESDGIEVALAALSRPKAIGARRLSRTLGADRVLRSPVVDSDAFVARVRAAAPDLLVSWFFPKRIPRRVLDLAPLGAVGVHPSLLPRHRGPDPYFWAIESGDSETGVTAHRLDEHYDTGPILAQRRISIDPSWNAWTLARRLDRPSLALLREIVGAFAQGRPPRETPQLEEGATLAPEPDDALLALSWEEEASRVVRRIRAASPWPGAFTEIGDHFVTLTEARRTTDFPRALAPGEGAVRADGVAVVRAGDVAVELTAGRDEEERLLDKAALAELLRRASVPSAAALDVPCPGETL